MKINGNKGHCIICLAILETSHFFVTCSTFPLEIKIVLETFIVLSFLSYTYLPSHAIMNVFSSLDIEQKKFYCALFRAKSV